MWQETDKSKLNHSKETVNYENRKCDQFISIPVRRVVSEEVGTPPQPEVRRGACYEDFGVSEQSAPLPTPETADVNPTEILDISQFRIASPDIDMEDGMPDLSSPKPSRPVSVISEGGRPTSGCSSIPDLSSPQPPQWTTTQEDDGWRPIPITVTKEAAPKRPPRPVSFHGMPGRNDFI